MKNENLIGERLKEYAIQYGSSTDLAKNLGLSPQHLNAYISGRSKPGADILIKLKELGCDIDWLLTGTRSEQSTKERQPIAEIVNRLRHIIDTYFDGRPVKLARAAGVNESLLSRWLNGVSTPNINKIKELKRADVNPDYIINGLMPELLSNKEAYRQRIEEIEETELIKLSKKVVHIPMIETAFPCGLPEQNQGNVHLVPIEEEMIVGVKNPYYLLCKGNSMYPVIKDGDYVIVETLHGDYTSLKNKDIVVAYLNGEFTIKRFFRQNGFVILVPENPRAAAPYVTEKADELHIIGIVKKILANASNM